MHLFTFLPVYFRPWGGEEKKECVYFYTRDSVRTPAKASYANRLKKSDDNKKPCYFEIILDSQEVAQMYKGSYVPFT